MDFLDKRMNLPIQGVSIDWDKIDDGSYLREIKAIKIKQIFDGDYGCEELQPGQKPNVTVTLVDDEGNEKYVSVEDDWLTENRLDIGSEWPKEI